MGEKRSSFHESRRLTWAEADFPFADARAAKPWKDFGAGLVFGDEISLSIAYRRNFKESLAIADEAAGSANYVRELFDEVSFADGFDWLSLRLLHLTDSFSVSDDRAARMDFVREYAEKLHIVDTPQQMMSVIFTQPFSLMEKYEDTRGFHALHHESLRFSATFSSQCVFQHESKMFGGRHSLRHTVRV